MSTKWEYTHDRQRYLIEKDGLMCEAHPGLPFMHHGSCSGPGMPWMIEGKDKIKALLVSQFANGLGESLSTDLLQISIDQLERRNKAMKQFLELVIKDDDTQSAFNSIAHSEMLRKHAEGARRLLAL